MRLHAFGGFVYALFGTGFVLAQSLPAPTTNTSTQNEQIEYVHNAPANVIFDRSISDYGIDVQSGTLNLQNAGLLLRKTVCSARPNPENTCDLDDPHTYAVINIVRWADPDTTNKNQTVQSSNWYIFNSSSKGYFWRNFSHWTQADFSGNNRIYGVNKLIILFVHLNISNPNGSRSCPIPYSATYEIDIQKRTPTNQSHLAQLAQLAVPAGASGAQIERAPPCPIGSYSIWGGDAFAIGYSTSTISFSSSITDPNGADQPTNLAPKYQIISEARSYWDISVAVPIKKISAVQYNTSGSTVVPSQVNRQNSFAVVDFYLPPRDLVGTNYSLIPHPLVGVSMAQQPLHSILAALGSGTNFGEIFAGIDFLKQQSRLKPSRYITKGQFSVGINIPINGVYQSLKKAK